MQNQTQEQRQSEAGQIVASTVELTSREVIRVTEMGCYRLTRSFVGLASDPAVFLEPGFVFHVTEISADGLVVFIPEFGGWTYCEIPAIKLQPEASKRVEQSVSRNWPNKKEAEKLVQIFGILVSLTGLAVWASRKWALDLAHICDFSFLFASIGYAASVFLNVKRK